LPGISHSVVTGLVKSMAKALSRANAGGHWLFSSFSHALSSLFLIWEGVIQARPGSHACPQRIWLSRPPIMGNCRHPSYLGAASTQLLLGLKSWVIGGQASKQSLREDSAHQHRCKSQDSGSSDGCGSGLGLRERRISLL